MAEHDARKHLTWQLLRSTCSTYLTNAPSIAGAAAVFVSAKRCGHSVMVAKKHYAGLVSVSREARTLEAAMGIEGLVAMPFVPSVADAVRDTEVFSVQ